MDSSVTRGEFRMPMMKMGDQIGLDVASFYALRLAHKLYLIDNFDSRLEIKVATLSCLIQRRDKKGACRRSPLMFDTFPCIFPGVLISENSLHT